MKMHRFLGTALMLAIGSSAVTLHAQQYQWTSFAGKPGGQGVSGTTASTVRFNTPRGVALDASGNLFVADTYNDIIRKITPSGVVSIFAGKAQTQGSANGTGANARFNRPHQIAFGPGGVLYVADKSNSCIRKITPSGVVTTLAGQAGNSGGTDGTGAAARFNGPEGLAVDASGIVYVADTSAHTIRKVTPAGVVTTLAGTAGVTGSADGTGAAARFYYPERIVLSGGNLYVTDNSNCTIRKVTLAGEVTTFAGQVGIEGSADGPVATAQFSYPMGLVSDASGNLYVGQDGDATIRKITPAGIVSTLAGTPGVWAYQDGTGAAARFNGIYSLAVNSSGDLFVADANNYAIRKITATGEVTTYAGIGVSRGSADGTGTAARFNYPEGMAMNSSGDLFVADSSNHTIRRVTPAGVVTTYAGTAGMAGSTDGPVASALFRSPQGLAFDASGNLLVADTGNAILRQITPAGDVSTLAGLAGQRGIVDGTGSAARFDKPTDVAVDAAGNAYVTEWSQHLVRRVTPAGEVTIVAGSSYGQVDGTGTAAKFGAPMAIAADGGGNFYVADFYGHTIRKMSPTYQVTTVAGLPGSFGSMDGLGNVARFNYPGGVSANVQGTVFVADYSNNTIRRISGAGVVSTIGGLAGTTDATDGLGSAARFASPQRIFAAPDGSLYVTDYNHHITKGTPLPTISIEQPVGVELADGTSKVDFGAVTIGQLPVKTFTIRNAGDVPLSGLSLSVNGANAADFTVTALSATTLAVGASTTFDITFHAVTAGARSAAVHVTSNDASKSTFDIALAGFTDTNPVVTVSPVSNVKSVGDTVTFQSLATHPLLPVKYQWKKNGVSIAGATSSDITLNSLTLASGATYSVVISAGTKSITRSATLSMINPIATQQVAAKAGSAVKLTASNTSGPCTFHWRKNGSLLPNSNVKTLVFTAIGNLASSGTYTCHLVRSDAAEFLAITFDVKVFEAKPVISVVQAMPDGAVCAPYSHQVTFNAGISIMPTSFSASGLPPGVTINTKTGLISGIPTQAKNYLVTVSAINSYGASSSTDIITIAPLPSGAVGSFMGMARGKIGIGGLVAARIDFTVASTGAITGSTILTGIKYPFTGKINASGVKPTSAITIRRAPMLPITINLVFNPSSNALDPTSTLSSGLSSGLLTGWRQVWRTTGAQPLNPAGTAAQRYNFVLNPPAGSGLPEGSGYGTFVVATNGTLTVTGKTPEGDSFTTAGFAGPMGQVLVYSALYAKQGMLIGMLDIDPNDSSLPDRYLAGSLLWSRPAATTSRYSPNGFSTTLAAYGARYNAPASPFLVLGMELGDKALINFSGGNLSTASINPNVAEFDIIAGNKPVMPALKAGNPGSVKFATLNATTGQFSGSFTLSDNELRTGAAYAGKKFTRTVTFNGVLTEDSMGHMGAGNFLLPELPTDTTPPTKTLIHSGYVQMQPKP